MRKKTQKNFDISISSNSSTEEIIKEYEKRIYDLQQLLEISQSLCSTLEYSTLMESILYTCMCQMHVLGAGIFVLDDIDSNAFALSTNYTGMDLAPEINYIIPFDSPIVSIVNEKGKAFKINDLRKKLDPEVDLSVISTLNPTLIVPLFQKNHINGILLLGERMDIGEGKSYSDYDINQILNIASLASVAINNAELLEKSSTDMMTHLKLKYFFFNALTDKLDISISQELPLSVIMFDIDFFKKFNDTWGHACGDYVLKMVAKIMKTSIRGQDMASRYGGEEFTIMLPNTDNEEAFVVAERIRTNIENTDFLYEGEHMKVTISGGISTYNVEENPVNTAKELVEQADKGLYYSKRNGRNRITFADKKILQEAEISG